MNERARDAATIRATVRKVRGAHRDVLAMPNAREEILAVAAGLIDAARRLVEIEAARFDAEQREKARKR